jgi:hypothetical protein
MLHIEILGIPASTEVEQVIRMRENLLAAIREMSKKNLLLPVKSLSDISIYFVQSQFWDSHPNSRSILIKILLAEPLEKGQADKNFMIGVLQSLAQRSFPRIEVQCLVLP